MEALRALGALVEAPAPELAPVAVGLELGDLPPAYEHTDLFTLQLVPYASIYLDASGRIGGGARDRIAGFWRALETEPPAEPDHLTVLLAAYSQLASVEARASDAEAREAAAHQRRVFLDEHLLSWLPAYLLKLLGLADGFYADWGRLLTRLLVAEASRSPRPPMESMHHRESPGPPGADAEPGEVVEALLAPVRSGVIITRSDLARAARELGIGSRMGERAFMLEAMLRQRPHALSTWLDHFFAHTVSAYECVDPVLSPFLQPWAARAERTRGRVLEEA